MRSWMYRLVCFLGREAVSFVNEAFISWGSMTDILLYRGEFLQILAHKDFSFALWDCLRADTLNGSCFLSNGGKSSGGLADYAKFLVYSCRI